MSSIVPIRPIGHVRSDARARRLAGQPADAFGAVDRTGRDAVDADAVAVPIRTASVRVSESTPAFAADACDCPIVPRYGSVALMLITAAAVRLEMREAPRATR